MPNVVELPLNNVVETLLLHSLGYKVAHCAGRTKPNDLILCEALQTIRARGAHKRLVNSCRSVRLPRKTDTLTCACSLNSAKPRRRPPGTAKLAFPSSPCLPVAPAFSVPTPVAPATDSVASETAPIPLSFMPNPGTDAPRFGTGDETITPPAGVTANPVGPTETDPWDVAAEHMSRGKRVKIG